MKEKKTFLPHIEQHSWEVVLDSQQCSFRLFCCIMRIKWRSGDLDRSNDLVFLSKNLISKSAYDQRNRFWRWQHGGKKRNNFPQKQHLQDPGHEISSFVGQSRSSNTGEGTSFMAAQKRFPRDSSQTGAVTMERFSLFNSHQNLFALHGLTPTLL